jgi:hypothetical protein
MKHMPHDMFSWLNQTDHFVFIEKIVRRAGLCWLDPDVHGIIRTLIFVSKECIRYAKLAYDVCLK